ncbi:NAD(P)H-dependent oxidoreductase [Paraflavitalea speifideaquila]|uniref:NADPH-dependent FMN reductase n=1 Tax=Paraflavitalea speifideaquila TaxID=3076558 RepID=UPI0028E2FEE5|nr:NAD(P)H-dependent oxidoreductase [Paraflavitalea speifideiaquila]
MKKIVAISGSLRTTSANTTLLKILGSLLPAEVDYTIFEGIGDLPHFNPDIDKEGPLLRVKALRTHIQGLMGWLSVPRNMLLGFPGCSKMLWIG